MECKFDRTADVLVQRLTRIRKRLTETRFDFSEHDAFVEAVCPWGNRIRCHPPAPAFGPIMLGLAYVELDVPAGTADGIARFYRRLLKTPATVADDRAGRFASVAVGLGQRLIFRETDQPLPDYDGHHVQVYVNDFSGPHALLAEKGLIFEESDQHQYRFRDLVDPEDSRALFTLEHEVRSMKHPLYVRPLVNRNPAQSNLNYAPGQDGFIWGTTEAN
jgi:hypothetical protein